VILDAGPAEVRPTATSLLVERFLDHVRHERGLAANTQIAYGRDLRDFSAWLGGRAAGSLSVRDLGDYLASLAKRDLARASIARQAATLRTFYGFLQLEGVVVESPADLLAPGRPDDAMPGDCSPPRTVGPPSAAATGRCSNCSTPPAAERRRSRACD